MVSKIVTDHLRDLAERLLSLGQAEMIADAEQLIDLAITLDEERDMDLTQVLDAFLSKDRT